MDPSPSFLVSHSSSSFLLVNISSALLYHHDVGGTSIGPQQQQQQQQYQPDLASSGPPPCRLGWPGRSTGRRSFVVVVVIVIVRVLKDVEPVEFSLPVGLVAPDTKLKFVNIVPVITRKVSPTPKITITRYSIEPTIQVDEADGSLIISTQNCQDTSSSSSSAGRLPYGAVAGWKKWGWTVATTVALSCWTSHHHKTHPHHPLSSSSLVTTAAGLFAVTAVTGSSWFIPGAAAQSSSSSSSSSSASCAHTVEIVMEGPATYRGAVETCEAEVNDVGHCPLPFPTFASCDPSPTVSCKIAVVGAGAGALYTALRMVDAEKVAGKDICIFEMTERVGGRLFSLRGLGPDSDLTVDAGGYRTWPEFTPTVHALITEYLEIPMECYDPGQDPCEVFTIIDPVTKEKAGFATFVEEMMTRLITAGACFYPYHHLDRLAKVPADVQTGGGTSSGSDSSSALQSTLHTQLYFANGVVATATQATILGIPQRPLLSVLRNSNFPDTIVDVPTLDALHSVQSVIATKLYLYYPRGHAWWLKLGLTSGTFERDGDARTMLLAGRYHDGHYICDDPADLETCHGFLLAVYANDLSGNKAQFFRRYQRDRPEPVTILSNSDLESAQFLSHAHDQLVQYHLYDNTNASYTGFEATAVFEKVDPPEFGVLSTWNEAIPWAGGAWHTWTELDNVEKATEPLVSSDLYVVNEAYSLLHGWAEGSLKLADQLLEKYFDVPRPWDFARTDLVQVVLQTSSGECVASEETTSSGGGAVSTGDAGGVLCFTQSALVAMADGTYKRIVDVVVGDYVRTGTTSSSSSSTATTGGQPGRVTAALHHPVGWVVPVAVHVTKEYGELVGTPDHPVWVDDPEHFVQGGQWVDLAHLDDTVRLEEQYVDVFYNLEIDGDVPGQSSHSYVVNGIVASGLGDNTILNTLFPRQDGWKNQQNQATAAVVLSRPQ